MSYQVFARKYRPQTFDEVVGQEHITQTLRNAVAGNRLAHAYLFVGPRGTGKTSTARILAKALNCEKGPTTDPCGKCDACRDIAAGTSLDVLEFDAASNTQVDKVRELIIDNVKYRPTSGRHKIYIVDEVHMLSNSSFNALLKTLEEPPEHVIFIFATTDVQKVPMTILSRCQRFDLRRVPAALIAPQLRFIAKQEKIALDDAAAQAIARGAEGGLRDAESMLDQLVAFCGDRISEEDVLSIFGFTAQQTVSELCGFILAGNSAEALRATHEQAEKGKDLSRLMSDLISHLRDLLVVKADPAGVKEDFGAELFDALEKQAEQIAMERLLELIEQLAAAEARMRWAPNKKLHFEVAIIKAIQTLSQATLTEIIDALGALRSGETPGGRAVAPPGASASVGRTIGEAGSRHAGPAPQKASRPKGALRFEEGGTLAATVPRAEDSPAMVTAAPASPVSPEEPSSAPVAATAATTPETLWVELLTIVRRERPLITSWVEAGVLISATGSVAVIGFPAEQRLAMESLMRPNNRLFLEKLLADLTGATFSLKCEMREGLVVASVPAAMPEAVAGSRAPAASAAGAPPDPIEAFKNDPLIRKAIELFRAEVQPA